MFECPTGQNGTGKRGEPWNPKHRGRALFRIAIILCIMGTMAHDFSSYHFIREMQGLRDGLNQCKREIDGLKGMTNSSILVWGSGRRLMKKKILLDNLTREKHELEDGKNLLNIQDYEKDPNATMIILIGK